MQHHGVKQLIVGDDVVEVDAFKGVQKSKVLDRQRLIEPQGPEQIVPCGKENKNAEKYAAYNVFFTVV
jgi:hypothetical protein